MLPYIESPPIVNVPVKLNGSLLNRSFLTRFVVRGMISLHRTETVILRIVHMRYERREFWKSRISASKLPNFLKCSCEKNNAIDVEFFGQLVLILVDL